MQLRLQAHEPCPVECQHRQADDHEEHDRHVGQNNSGSVVPEGPRELRALFDNRPIWDHRAHSIVLDACQYWERLPRVATMISAGHGILLALAISHDGHLRHAPWRSSRKALARQDPAMPRLILRRTTLGTFRLALRVTYN